MRGANVPRRDTNNNQFVATTVPGVSAVLTSACLAFLIPNEILVRLINLDNSPLDIGL